VTKVKEDVEVWCLGGAHLDHIAKPKTALTAESSSPGIIQTGFGGVAYNIAASLNRLGAKTTLVGAVGEDLGGQALAAKLLDQGIENRLIKQAFPTGSYLAIDDEQGRLVHAVSDLRALEELDPAVLAQALTEKPSTAALLLDANLLEDQITAILEAQEDCFVAVEVVSITKSLRLRSVLDRVDALFCNLVEANTLLRRNLNSPSDAARQLMKLGPNIVSVTNGGEAAALFSDGCCFEKMPKKVEASTTNGAGDCYAATLLFGLLSTIDPEAAMQQALEAAANHLEGTHP
jgi:pseudouridine kinase